MKRLGIFSALFAFLLIALGAVASLLTIQVHVKHLMGVSPNDWYCNINAALNCGSVLTSPIATLWGLPLGAYGLAYYLALALLSPSLRRPNEQIVPLTALFFLSTIGLLVSVGLFVYSEAVIGALCPLCAVTYAANLLLFAVYAIAVGTGKVRALVEGAIALLVTFPARVFGRRAGAPGTFRVFLAVALSTAFALFVPELLFAKFTKPAEPLPPVEQAFLGWKSAAVDDLGVNDPGGVSGDYATGPASAPIQVVEFSDFECPACRMLYPNLEALLKRYEGKVHFVYRNFPLDMTCNSLLQRPMHLNACYAAFVARCAGEQGKFWETAEYLFTEAFENAEEDPAEVVRSGIDKAISGKLQLDGEAIKECLASGRATQRVREDVARGSALKIQGTPSLWVNGKRAPMFAPALLERIFNSVLAGEK